MILRAVSFALVLAVALAGQVAKTTGRDWLEGEKGWAEAGNKLWTVDTAYLVGVGMSNPGRKLDIVGSGRGLVRISSDPSSDQCGIEFVRIGESDNGFIFIENYGTSGQTTDSNRLVIMSRDNGDQDYIVLRNDVYNQGTVDVLEVHRNFVQIGQGNHSVKSYLLGDVGIKTTNPQYELDVEGYVQAYGYYTGDIIFQKDGKGLWRMFEEEDGIYLENLNTGEVHRVCLESDLIRLNQLVTTLQQRIRELELQIKLLNESAE